MESSASLRIVGVKEVKCRGNMWFDQAARAAAASGLESCGKSGQVRTLFFLMSQGEVGKYMYRLLRAQAL
jgi:hypothetical protein